MTAAGLAAFIATYGLVLLLPLAVIEGPIVSIVAGVLCGRGLLDWYWVYPLLVLGDLGGDALYYAIGRMSHGWLHRIAPKIGIPVARGEAFADRVKGRAIRMLLIGKWTHAIGGLVLIAAGAARIPLLRFMVINFVATLPKSALLLAIGYWTGGHFQVLMDRFGAYALVLPVLGIVAACLVLKRRSTGDQAA